jgi:hypothetical protein
VKNVKMVVSEDRKTLTITVDLTQDFGPSASGKTTIVASTEGNADVPDVRGMKVGLNVYKK